MSYEDFTELDLSEEEEESPTLPAKLEHIVTPSILDTENFSALEAKNTTDFEEDIDQMT